MKSLHVGSATIDIICIVAAENIERMTFTNEGKSFLMVESGRKVPAESITDHVGGGACNTAVSLARRGWRTEVLARVGDDLNADAVREHLDRYGVGQDRLITDPGAATGTSVMIASHDRNASIFVQRGANENLTPDDLPESGFAGYKMVYVAPLSSGSADCFPAIVAAAKRSGATVISNPGIRQLTSRTAAFIGALAKIDLLSVNRVEAEALVPAFAARSEGPDPVPRADAPALLRRGLSFGGFEMGLLRFLHEVQAAGPRWVCLTDGTDGAWLAAPEGVFWRPSAPAEVAGTAGAGDSYTSTIAAALTEGASPQDAMLEAAVNSASVVSVVDTTSGLLNRAGLDEARQRVGEMPLYRA
ncbi:carbohydrate kinase family protein [Limibaculum sp. M0105]|uniref:Carbohydrate kinase family protein n=1 Tax=Thermohalobaculum xanthum TaxID=2753746 RepID=A0A8J7M5F0_9RHOB|nr:carbohydrate kinase family protein [Thermohalobaculum xanthum]MBK0398631.1 carbohydrate kinase family protein [Thermohalobaculum xanthum]